MRRGAAVVVGAVVTALAAIGLGLVDVGERSEAGSSEPLAATSTTADSPAGPTCPVEVDGAEEQPLSDYLGLSTHLMWDEDGDPAVELPGLAACGVRHIREDLLWEVVEPEQGRFDWERADRLMEAAARAEIEVLGILGYSAAWASADRNAPPSDVGAFTLYAAAVVDRYGPSGTFWAGLPDVAARPLQAVEIWNEPWGYWSWSPEPDVDAYARLATSTAAAVRAADPEVAILVPGDLLQVRTDGRVEPWLASLVRAGPELLPLVDAYSVHPYPDPRDVAPDEERDDPRWDYRRVGAIDEEAAELGARRPIWITEIGWSTTEGEEGVSEEEQATYLRDAVEIAVDEWPFVDRIYAYTWTVDRDDAGDREARYGLRRNDGSPKPALVELLQLLGGAGS